MKCGPKPVRRCHTCRLNLGAYCWQYACPRRQWSRGHCPGFDNETLWRRYQEWQAAPRVKTRRQLRQEAFRAPRARRQLRARQDRAAPPA